MSLRNIINKIIIFPLADLSMHTQIMHSLKIIIEMNNWSVKEISNWQNVKIKKLITHSYNNTKYYNNLLNKLSLTPDDFNEAKDLKKLPVLTKKIIRDNYNDLIPKNITAFRYHKGSTGGSTGNPLKFYLDNESWSNSTALSFYYWGKIGYNIGDKYIALGSSSLFPINKKSLKHDIYYWLKGKVPMNAMNLDEKVIIEYLSFIKKNRVRFIYGYASAIYLLSKKAIELNCKLPNIRACISTSEILLDEYKTVISAAFSCPVMDAYGAADGGINAYKINNLFEVGYSSIVEVDGVEIDGFKTGKVLTTDLMNYTMPFIRYEVGDEVKLLTKVSLDYNGQLISKIYGRIPDIMKLKNGRVLTGPGFTILFKDLNVIAYNIQQMGDLEILCEIQKDVHYVQEEENLIINTLKKYAGLDCKVRIKYVKEFGSLASGKRRYFMSNF